MTEPSATGPMGTVSIAWDDGDDVRPQATGEVTTTLEVFGEESEP